MLNSIDLYYFSPTGGTKKTGEVFARAISGEINLVDLGGKELVEKTPESEVIVVAAPVFGGRIPSVMSEKLKKLDGVRKKAITLVVYGNRAYEDALLELNDVLEENGFQIVASGAFVAQHSIVPEVANGRPDEKDREEIKEFAKKVYDKLSKGMEGEIQVPGNHPYKSEMNKSATPLSLSSCILCGKCETVCPTGAIKVSKDTVLTSLEKCIMCMACTVSCPKNARILPPQLQELMDQKLGKLKSVHRENEIFL